MLDADLCEKARLARDRRFDGRFFIGVRSTGVYCRPICPARLPRRRNVAFYPSAAAAEEAGFRPCRRCRPETAPAGTAWLGTGATVSRALRLIEDGALDRGDVAALAARLGIGARQLRRLFSEHVGAAPLAVARTRRTHFARRLIDETRLPMTVVAEAAGFGSVRQFNDAVRDCFHTTPRELRRSASGATRAPGGLRLRLPYREPFDWRGLLAFLGPRALAGVEQVVGNTHAASARRTAGRELRYQRAIARRTLIVVQRAAEGGALWLSVCGEAPADLIGLATRARRLFDLGADPARIAADLGRDPLLRPLLRRRPGLRLPGAFDPFEIAVRAILGQQVSVRAATTLGARLVARFGEATALCATTGIRHRFPTPARLADADITAIGLPGARAQAIRHLARLWAEGRLQLDGARELEASVAALCALPGVGDWTAQYIALRALGEPDAFPAGDLGLRKALARGGKPLSERALRERAEAWRPWRGYAAIHLWTHSSVLTNRKGNHERNARNS